MSTAKFITLGCGSAMPLKDRANAAHLLCLSDKLYLIDCGEGAQVALKETGVHTERINNIFISHLHGDHIFGLLPLLSTLSMRGRRSPLTIHAHKDLVELIEPLRKYFMADLSFELTIHPIDPRKAEVIFEDNKVVVSTIPLKHSVPTCGFLFREKEQGRKTLQEKLKEYDIPLAAIPGLKDGDDFVTDGGEVISNSELTIDPKPVRSFAYCSDTAYTESIVDIIKGVDMLYHEATYCEADKDRIRKTMHSTARQAAEIAKKAGVKRLVIGHYSSRYRKDEEIKQMAAEAREVFENTVTAKDMAVFRF